MTPELQILILIVAVILIIILNARAHSSKPNYDGAVQQCIDLTEIDSDHRTQAKLEETKLREKANKGRGSKT